MTTKKQPRAGREKRTLDPNRSEFQPASSATGNGQANDAMNSITSLPDLASSNGATGPATPHVKPNLVPLDSPATSAVQSKETLPETVAQLQSAQRQRAVVIKSRNMQANRLQALIAGTLGYDRDAPAKERIKKFKEAAALIKDVLAGKTEDAAWLTVIRTTGFGIKAFNILKDDLESQMRELVKGLPVFAWMQRPEQRGFSSLSLAIVVGETGDLSKYANPAKVWRRMGCAPWVFEGKTKMGATWKGGREGKLPREEWAKFGYSPRRRSIAYLIGENLLRQNGRGNGARHDETDADLADPCVDEAGDKHLESETAGASLCVDEAGDVTGEFESGAASLHDDSGPATKQAEPNNQLSGPYRRRYDQAKASAQIKHPDWSKLRLHRHGILLAAKLLLKNLWVEWNK